MAFDLTPSKLREEVDSMLELRRKVTRLSRSRIEMYAGDTARAGFSNYQALENHCFEWVTNIVPHYVSSAPTALVSDDGFQDEGTATLQTGLRSLLGQIKIARTLTAIAMDMQFDFGVGLMALENTPGYTMKGVSGFAPQRPNYRRLSPRQFFTDHRAVEIGAARCAGHLWIKPLTACQTETEIDEQTGAERTKYDQEALKRVVLDAGIEEIRSDLLQDGLATADRTNVVGVDLWLREENQWCTFVLDSGEGVIMIRPLREYTGHADGPYFLHGTHWIPDQVYPLPNLAVTQRMAEETNSHRRQAADDAKHAKRLYVGGGTNVGVVGSIKNAPSGSFLSIPGFDGMVTELKLSGAMPESLEYVGFLRDALSRASGLADMQRGQVTGATAQEVAQAGAFIDVRLKTAQNRFREDIQDVLSRLICMADNDPSVAFAVMREDPATGQKIRATFLGGQDEQQDQSYPWKRAYTVEIEPMSMEYVQSQAIRQQMTELQAQIVAILQASASNPALDPKPMIDDLMQTMNIPNASARYVDWKVLNAMRGMLMGSMMTQTLGSQYEDGAESGGGAGGAKQHAGGRKGRSTNSRTNPKMAGVA